MKRGLRLETALKLLFVGLCLALFTWFNVTKPRILVLHSYDPGYAWTRDVNEGLRRVLRDSYRYQLHWHYMDTKRHPSAQFKESAGVAALAVVREIRPDVIIAVDDDAQQYVTRHLLDDPRIQVVFAGLNSDVDRYGFRRARNVTGILEQIPVRAIRDMVSVAAGVPGHGKPVRIAYLGDRSDSVGGDVRQLTAFDWAPAQLVSATRVDTWPMWQARVREFAGQADVILVSGYRGLHRAAGDETLVPAREVVQWTEAHSAVPVISSNGFFVEDGGMLAIGTSPYEQGEEAAQRALAIALEGQAAAGLPIKAAQEFIVTMNATLMRARGFELPAIYKAAARTGNTYLP